MEKPSLPKGTRDFGPVAMARRQFIFDTIRTVFRTYGYQPLETPAMEKLSTLTGKYGDEGDQLLFKVLNSGDFISKVDDRSADSRTLTPQISEKGLRYDLTVPFARYVVMNRHEIAFPFRRYQMQPVWRADRPQKGRYCEFYQCDADVIGTHSLICEAEIVLMIQEVFSGLRIPDYTIKVNHRAVLSGLAEVIGAGAQESSLFVALDKLDKIGQAGVAKELAERNFSEESIGRLFSILSVTGTNAEKISSLEKQFGSSEMAQNGLMQLREIFTRSADLGSNENRIEFDLALARGLSYYTGAIFEVKINGVAIGSVSGGGRYDNLTGVFGMEGVSGVGISFGVDRLFDAMEELVVFPEDTLQSSRVLVIAMDSTCLPYSLAILQSIRKRGVPAEVYPDQVKLKKPLDYANKRGIRFAIIIGSQEMASRTVVLKDLQTGEQQQVSLDMLAGYNFN